MVPEVDPKVDYAFKRLFGREPNRPLVIHLLNSVPDPPAPARVVNLDLLNPFNEKDRLDDKLSILDIKARDQSGRQYNVEMQLLANPFFRQRVPYYWARLHQSQLREGEDYRLLRPTLSICFVNSELFPEVPAYQLIFELRERKHPLVFSDDLAVHLLELPKFTKSAAELATPLDVWLYFLKHGAHLDTAALPPALDAVAEIHRAMEELTMIAQSDEERERYESRLKAQRDWTSTMAWERDEGRKEEQVKQIHFCQGLLKRAHTPAAQLLALPREELERMVQELQAEVLHSLARTA
jgi:predicted transposase/invertase (TIGR01784 family)